MFEKRKIGVALSGGAARGLAHIGVLEVLDETGVEVSAVSGCSMGAIVGAIYSLGIPLKEVKNYLKNTDWRNFLIASVLGLSRAGIVNDRKVDAGLQRFLGSKTFSDCKKQFCCVAVDIMSGEKKVIKSGSLKEAVRASISIPGMFPPVQKENALLVDGGVIEPLPTHAIKELGCNFIIASSIVFESENPPVPEEGETKNHLMALKIKKISIQTIIDKSMNLIYTQMVQSYLREAHIVIEPKIGDFGFFDFVKGEQIIEAGRRAALKKIPEIKKKLRIR